MSVECLIIQSVLLMTSRFVLCCVVLCLFVLFCCIVIDVLYLWCVFG
jgi:hypothetical protein